jgi:3-phenylpropionate/trans-cinnamate dioxygenase ferredoxin reductase component
MNHLHVKYLLVGGGLASCSAARAIRERDADGSVLLVGQEINRPYHRPPLSKAYLRREVQRDALFAIEPDWFPQHQVELRTGRRVAHLDVSRCAATLDSGEEVSFDRLLLATGSSPAHLNAPGADLPNLFTVRTVEDVGQLHNAIDKATREGHRHDRGRGRVTVIGGGLLGVELAGSFTQLGLAVDLIVAHAHPWDRFAGESTGRFLTRYLESKGVTVHLNAHPQRLEGDGRVQRVVLEPGRVLPCDFAVAAVGSVPNKDVLRGTPIAAEKAILVDEHCRTNVPDVYAAGDCCVIRDPLFGKYRWIDHWDNAAITGTLAGRNMAGADEPYSTVSTYSTEVFDLTARVWGEARFVDRRHVRGTPKMDAPSFVEVGIATDGRIAQVLAVGPAAEDPQLADLVARRLAVDGNQELLKDPNVPLSEILK